MTDGAVAQMHGFAFEVPARERAELTLAPWGDLVICEDGSNEQFLRGVTKAGEVYNLGRNALNGSEFCGSCFAPNHPTLFVNIQNPGIIDRRRTTSAPTGMSQNIKQAFPRPIQRRADVLVRWRFKPEAAPFSGDDSHQIFPLLAHLRVRGFSCAV